MTAADRNTTADALDWGADDAELAALLIRHADRYDERIGHATLMAKWMREAAARLLRTPDTPTDSECSGCRDRPTAARYRMRVAERDAAVAAVTDADIRVRVLARERDAAVARLEDHKASLAIQAFTAPDEDEAVMMESLVARIGDCIAERDAAVARADAAEAEVERLRAGVEAIVYGDSIRISAEVYRMLDALFPPPAPTCPTCDRSTQIELRHYDPDEGRELCPDPWHQETT